MDRAITPTAALLTLCLLLTAGCSTPGPVLESAEFAHVQLGVLQGLVQNHYEEAAGSIERQKETLRGQFSTNRRLMRVTRESLAFASAGDAKPVAMVNALKAAADKIKAADDAEATAREKFERELKAMSVGPGLASAPFDPLSAPLQALAVEAPTGDRVAFFSAYLLSVVTEANSLKDAAAEAAKKEKNE